MKKKIKEEIGQQLRTMSTHAVMRSQAIADKLEINTTDLETLEVLFREGKATAGAIANYTGLTTGAVTGIIDRLTKREFVARELDPNDRRKIIVVLNTRKVAEEVVPLYQSIQDSVDKLLDSYTEKELEIILGFLVKSSVLSQKDLLKMKE